MPPASTSMSGVFTSMRAPLDRVLLGSNASLALGLVVVLCLALSGVRPSGWLDVPVAALLFAWLFATPLLAVFGGLRAHSSGWRRALAAHSVFASVWAMGLLSALALPLLRTA